MKKVIVFLVMAFVGLSFGQVNENWNGWGDTAQVHGFYSDTTLYSAKFKVSAMENVRLDCYIRDTANAGMLGDSCVAVWGIQMGHPAWTTTKAASPVIAWGSPLTIDSIDMLDTTLVGTADTSILAADGTFNIDLRNLDTLSVSGWAYQSRSIAPEWDVYMRMWIKGLTGNALSKKIGAIFQVVRRLAAKTSGN